MPKKKRMRNPVTLFLGFLTASFLILAASSLVLLKSNQKSLQQHSYDETGMAALQVRLHFEILLAKLVAVESVTLQGSVDDAVVAFDVLYERLEALPDRPTYDKLLDAETLALRDDLLNAMTAEIPRIEAAAEGERGQLLGMYQRLLPLRAKAGRLGHRPVQVASERRTLATQNFQEHTKLFSWIVTGFIISGLMFAGLIFKQMKTEHKLSERLRSSRDEAELASAAKSQFLSHMSHEFRTPMNAILGFAQLLDMAKLDGKHNQSVKQILTSGYEMLDLIDQVLELERINAGKINLAPTRVHPQKILQDCQEMHKTQAKYNNIKINIIETDVAMVEDFLTDHRRLQQILFCFLSNAINYNRPDGTVSIAAEMMSVDKIRFSVRDTGMGIPLNQQADIFQAFTRSGRESQMIKGTGVGLTIAHELVKMLRGSINFISEPGKGSIFWVTLPVQWPEDETLILEEEA